MQCVCAWCLQQPEEGTAYPLSWHAGWVWEANPSWPSLQTLVHLSGRQHSPLWLSSPAYCNFPSCTPWVLTNPPWTFQDWSVEAVTTAGVPVTSLHRGQLLPHWLQRPQVAQKTKEQWAAKEKAFHNHVFGKWPTTDALVTVGTINTDLLRGHGTCSGRFSFIHVARFSRLFSGNGGNAAVLRKPLHWVPDVSLSWWPLPSHEPGDITEEPQPPTISVWAPDSLNRDNESKLGCCAIAGGLKLHPQKPHF